MRTIYLFFSGVKGFGAKEGGSGGIRQDSKDADIHRSLTVAAPFAGWAASQ
jgi:hypothetical protein